MKIAYLHQYFNSPDMNGSTRSFEMARRLVAQGHEVEMITTWREETNHDDWYITQEDGINIHWLPVPYTNSMGFAGRLSAFLNFALKAKARTKFVKPDLIFATSTPLTIALPAVQASKSLKIPMVFEVRDLWPELPIATGDLTNPVLKIAAKQLEKYAYKNSQEIVALSPGMADGVTACGFPVERVTIIPNSSDLDLFAESKQNLDEVLPNAPALEGRKLVVYCGTFGRINRVTYLAEIAAKAIELDPSVAFVAIGHGAEFDLVHETAEKFGVLNKNIFIYPSVAKKHIPSIFKAATLSLSLFSDIKEMEHNSANKFFDTLAAGRAIGINYGGWQSDLIKEYEMGLVFENRNSDEAAEQIVNYLSDDQRIEEAGQNARIAAETLFSRDLLAKKLNTVLERSYATYSYN